MGTRHSCNPKWCNFICKLENSSEKRRTLRRSCKCIGYRPKFLRFRRKTRLRDCNCTQKPDENLESVVPLRSQLHTGCVSQSRACQNYVAFCSQGTNTCFCESQDDEIQGLQNIVQNCSRPLNNKNICRFTVDAYFT